MGRVEVITRAERRRVWLPEQKREIVLQSLDPSACPSDVARRHGINTSLLYTWRRQMVDGQLGEVVRAVPDFVRVGVTASPPCLDGSPAAPSKAMPQAGVQSPFKLRLPE